MANQPRTPHRTIRIPDETWLPAHAKAKQNNDNLSQIIRDGLDEYIGDFDYEAWLAEQEANDDPA